MSIIQRIASLFCRQPPKYVFGVCQPLPLRGFPQGRIRLRLRKDSFAKAFVKSPTGIRRFLIGQRGAFWVPMYEQGAKVRTGGEG